MTEISDDELECQMRAKLFQDRKPSGLTPEEQHIAGKLMGKGNADRLARAKAGAPFRYRPPLMTAEFYEVPPDGLLPGFWIINTYEDGVRTESWRESTEDECRRQVSDLRKRGFVVKVLETEWMKQKAERPDTKSCKRENARKAMLAKVGGFR
jgi:hypothetical protein